MAEEDRQWESWVRDLAAGDDRVVQSFWDRYGARLQGLAAQFLTTRLYRRVEPEDIVQSVCRSFFVRARDGQFELADRDSLWRLLCAITLAKVRQQARYHGRQKRSVHHEASLEDSRLGPPALAAAQPTPEESAAFADQLQNVLDALDDEERQIILSRLEEYTMEEIATRQGCSERTVRRILKRVQSRLQRLLQEC
jgi:RNA polymerase sigma factor (sigma-70 family)